MGKVGEEGLTPDSCLTIRALRLYVTYIATEVDKVIMLLSLQVSSTRSRYQ
jgi:hypothetical protein